MCSCRQSNRWMNAIRIAALALAAGAALSARAQPLSAAFTYQGELAAFGSPTTGLHDMRFRLYDASTGGVQVGPELCANDVSVESGKFTVSLDFGAQFAGQQRFLEIDVRTDTGLDCSNATGYAVLSPRQPLTAAPNAIYALNAATAANAGTLNGQTAAFYNNAANLTGTLPSARLSGSYSGTLNLTNASNTFVGSGTGLTALNATSLSTGTVADARLSSNIPRLNTANAFGAFDNTFAGNVGIGTTTPTSRLTLGGETAQFPVAFRILPTAHATSRRTSFRMDDWQLLQDTGGSGTKDFGLWQVSASSYRLLVAPTGSVGIGTTIPLTKLQVEESAAGAITLSSYATAGTGESIAGWFESNSNAGTGLYAIATTNSGVTYGLRANTDSNAANAMGVRGEALRNGANFGVYGQALGASSFGVYANGRLGASGTKSFMIDHPLDPANKVLYHYSAESPDVLNIYSGVIDLDASGEAWVTLPEYFGAINVSPRYSLTSVGAPAPMLHIAEEIRDNRFKVAGGAPNAKVSWEVKALRHDQFVVQYGAPVEAEKAPENKGKYLQPQLFGQPAEKSQFYAPTPAPAARGQTSPNAAD